jgi:hypothetical protein
LRTKRSVSPQRITKAINDTEGLKMGDTTSGQGDGHERSQFGWKKSSYSLSNGHCVETASFAHGRVVGVRDSRRGADGTILLFERGAWSAFTGQLRASVV